MSGNSVRKFIAVLALLPAFCFSAAAAFVVPVAPQPVELAWDANPDPTVAGYMLSYGTNSGNLDNELDAGTNTSIEVPDLAAGQTNYFVIAAYNLQGVLGAPSTPISYVVPGSQTVAQTGALEVTLNVPEGQWSVDSGAWQTNGAIVAGVSVGPHTVAFSAMSGWTTPASQTISIADDQTNSISATYVAVPQTGALEMTLNVAGAQWAVDNGTLQSSGSIVSGLSVGSHTVAFSTMSGWTTPASQTITVADDQTNFITATYVAIPQTGALAVSLNASGAQWSVDGGALQSSGTIVSGLSVGSHTITFSVVSGWTTPASQAVSIVASKTNTITATYVAISQTGAVKATLNATGAQWAVDSGTLQKSGAIVSGLSAGSHIVTFSAASGYTTPSSQTISIVANQTNSITANYVAVQTGSLRVTLNVSSGQWAVDGGTLQNSGSIVSSLSVGSHTITFSAVSGYNTPPSQTMTVAANRTTFDSATYVAVPVTGSLEVTLNVSGAQWAVDGGTLNNSAAIVSSLSVGSHTITFTSVAGWTSPASQTIALIANQTNSVSATYVLMPQTGAVKVTLSPSAAQWAVDNGTLQNSGAIVSGLSLGSHTITFSAMSGWTTPASQTITVVANQTNSVTGTYIAIPQTGAVQVTLSPAAAQWSVDSGTFQTNGAVVSGLSVGSHTISFSAMSGWTTPAIQTITVVANQTNSITASFVAIPQTGAVQVTLNPAVAQWSVDSGILQNSGAIVSGLSVGSHTITFSTMSGWTTPARQTITVMANQTNSVTATYIAIPQTGAVQVTLSPTVAEWSVDSGTFQTNGAVVSGLSVGSHTITFSSMSGWTTPGSQTITVVANQTNSITATYIAIPQTGAVQVTLNPAVAQWSVDSGTFQTNGAVVSGLSVGSHTITFSPMSGWTTPASQTITVVANQTNVVTATYIAIPQTGAVQVTLNPVVAQWAVDSGALQNSGVIVSGLSVGSHTITFSAMSGWTTPGSQTITVVANQTNSVAGTYIAIPQTGAVQVTLSPTVAEWSVDSGTFQTNGAVVSGLSVGSHTITFSPVSGWTTPGSQTITVVANQTNSITATYIAIPQTGAVQVTLNPAVAQWSVDSGALQNSGATVSGLSVGSHTISFSAMSGWTTPASQTITVVASQTNTVTAAYIAIPQTGAVQVTLNPAVAQWSVDSGIVQNSGAIVSGLSAGSHTISFTAMSGWTTPASQTISIVANQTNTVTATYIAIPQTGAVQVTLNPAVAEWSVDSGTFQTNGAIVSGLSVGSHTISFSAMSGWTTPANQTITVVANQTNSVTATYVATLQTGEVQVTLNPAVAQWSVDSGTFQNSGAIVSGLSVGLHTVTFNPMSGWTRPASQTIAIVANQTNSITATYLAIPQTGSLELTLNVPGAEWSVDNGNWQDSGSAVVGLSVGSHTLSFTTMDDWISPTNQVVSVIANQTNSISANYVVIPQTGSLQATLNPSTAQWAVDQGAWQNSGAVVSGLSVGSHTVSFSSLTGWTTPTNQTVAIVANQTNAISAAYTITPPPIAVVGPSGTVLAHDPTLLGRRRKKHTSHIVSDTANERTTASTVEPKSTKTMAGTYNGLFYPAKGVSQETSGMLSGLILRTNGSYSGKILIHGSSLAFSGTLDAAAHSRQLIARSPRLGGPLTLDMTVTWNGGSPGIVGTVSGNNGNSWMANLIADPAATSTKSYQYTLLFPPAANAPAGFGSATVVNEGGSATVVGALANGKRFSQHVPVSADGSAPFYVYLGANEVVFGWIMNLYSATPGGEIAWIKGDTRMQVNYNEGFTSLIAATGSSRIVAAPDNTPIDIANAVEESSRNVQSQIAKISGSVLTSTVYGTPNGF